MTEEAPDNGEDIPLTSASIGAVVTPKLIGKINYKMFSCMTNKFGIICNNWPLEQFSCPGSINSMPELVVLRSAFESGATSFCKLSAEELEAWRKEQFDQLVTERNTIEQKTAKPRVTPLSPITSPSAASTDDMPSVAASVAPPPMLATTISAPPPVPATTTAVPSLLRRH
ncbi:uncharacterized protein PHACADRAFT_201640 [Phanerochaete carnosa HHB-10118-sp]|uniref:Uncharacterized protein n=1 Tax=Phanerochaete carnosa (strain HHB-10118-sp) TaxID=650164 RepID=K5VS49_PHACS|nr:uncharacterized protein PHACADRAFT_201640 [Phanerochaete carnosa HHB-10118-sp]EKM49384.1 hypothetical protein PHACADRAFT_201640 [Phanerochaete carnosa HHB-10118-sp]